MAMDLISHDQNEKSLNEGSTCYTLVTQETEPKIEMQISRHIKLILEKFFEVLSKYLPGELPLIRDIQYAIDLVSGATLSNLPITRWTQSSTQSYNDKYKSYLTKDSSKKVWAHVQFPHFWHQRKMTHGVCVWIVAQLTKSLSSIVFPFPILMICWIWCRVSQYFSRLILRVGTTKLEFGQGMNGKLCLRPRMSYINGWLCPLDSPMLLAPSWEYDSNVLTIYR